MDHNDFDKLLLALDKINKQKAELEKRVKAELELRKGIESLKEIVVKIQADYGMDLESIINLLDKDFDSDYIFKLTGVNPIDYNVPATPGVCSEKSSLYNASSNLPVQTNRNWFDYVVVKLKSFAANSITSDLDNHTITVRNKDRVKFNLVLKDIKNLSFEHLLKDFFATEYYFDIEGFVRDAYTSDVSLNDYIDKGYKIVWFSPDSGLVVTRKGILRYFKLVGRADSPTIKLSKTSPATKWFRAPKGCEVLLPFIMVSLKDRPNIKRMFSVLNKIPGVRFNSVSDNKHSTHNVAYLYVDDARHNIMYNNNVAPKDKTYSTEDQSGYTWKLMDSNNNQRLSSPDINSFVGEVIKYLASGEKSKPDPADSIKKAVKRIHSPYTVPRSNNKFSLNVN